MQRHDPQACRCLIEDDALCPQCEAEMTDVPTTVVVIFRFATGTYRVWAAEDDHGRRALNEYTYETPQGLHVVRHDGCSGWWKVHLPGAQFAHDEAETLAAAERLVCRAVAQAAGQDAVEVRTRPGKPRGKYQSA